VVGLYRTRAVVLRVKDFGEADRLVTLLTAESGKVQALAKGVRRPKSKLAGGISIFSLGDFQLWQGKSLDGIKQVEIIESYRLLRENIEKMAYASYVCELTDQLQGERDADSGVFSLVIHTLAALQDYEDLDLVLGIFLLRVLSIGGYLPEINVCVSCGSVVPIGSSLVLSASGGGILCADCIRGEKSASAEALSLLRFLVNADYRLAGRIKAGSVNYQVVSLLMNYVTYYLEKRLKSSDFLDIIREEKGGFKSVNGSK